MVGCQSAHAVACVGVPCADGWGTCGSQPRHHQTSWFPRLKLVAYAIRCHQHVLAAYHGNVRNPHRWRCKNPYDRCCLLHAGSPWTTKCFPGVMCTVSAAPESKGGRHRSSMKLRATETEATSGKKPRVRRAVQELTNFRQQVGFTVVAPAARSLQATCPGHVAPPALLPPPGSPQTLPVLDFCYTAALVDRSACVLGHMGGS